MNTVIINKLNYSLVLLTIPKHSSPSSRALTTPFPLYRSTVVTRRPLRRQERAAGVDYPHMVESCALSSAIVVSITLSAVGSDRTLLSEGVEPSSLTPKSRLELAEESSFSDL